MIKTEMLTTNDPKSRNNAKAELHCWTPKSEDGQMRYIEDARKILDMMAADNGEFGVNAMGIKTLIWYMLYQVENGYSGKDNQ